MKYNLVNNLKVVANNDYTIRGTNTTLEGGLNSGTIAADSKDNQLDTTKWVYTNFGYYKSYKCSDIIVVSLIYDG